jgi:hypothetical protein
MAVLILTMRPDILDNDAMKTPFARPKSIETSILSKLYMQLQWNVFVSRCLENARRVQCFFCGRKVVGWRVLFEKCEHLSTFYSQSSQNIPTHKLPEYLALFCLSYKAFFADRL